MIFACTTILSIAAPLMPTAELALGCMAGAAMFGLAGAVPQNAAIQRIAPNEMRGQVTAVYLFMFTFFGAMGPAVIGFVSTFVVGDEQQIWKAILITAVVLPAPPKGGQAYRLRTLSPATRLVKTCASAVGDCTSLTSFDASNPALTDSRNKQGVGRPEAPD